MDEGRSITPGLLALRLGVQGHIPSRLIKKGLVPHQKCGRLRLIASTDFETTRVRADENGRVKTAEFYKAFLSWWEGEGHSAKRVRELVELPSRLEELERRVGGQAQ